MSDSKAHEYTGDGFKVTYDKEICVHAGVCVKTLPQVFNPKAKPWVNTGAASKEDIQNMIKTCPSGFFCPVLDYCSAVCFLRRSVATRDQSTFAGARIGRSSGPNQRAMCCGCPYARLRESFVK